MRGRPKKETPIGTKARNIAQSPTQTVKITTAKDASLFEKNLSKYVDFVSWVRFYPDLFLDLIKPKVGGFPLHPDQRIFLRCISRFFSFYGCFPRGWGKTYLEVLAMFVVSISHPNIELALTAQTKENAAEILKDKILEILRIYPIFENELMKPPKLQKGDAEILFKNGSRIDILANSQTSKGQRRKRISVEEAALLDNVTFEDALKPIVEVSRYTCGKLAVVNPEELNQQINFFTTPGYRGSDEWQRNLKMIANMIDLKGQFVLGSDWMLGCWYGRGSTKSQILEMKETTSPIAFSQNYGGKWTGSSSNALVNINKLMNCRSLTSPVFEQEKKQDEYLLGVDVARSQNTNNNQSSVVIGKINRNLASGRISSVDIVNVIHISNTLNFTAQACTVKKIKNAYHAKIAVVDGNGLGSGLVDELLKESIDPITKESLGCWDTINTDNMPESENAEKCLYDLKAQSAQSKIVTTFIDMVDSGKLRLLEKKQVSLFSEDAEENYEKNVLPFLQTDLLVEEISNLKIKYLPSGALSVEKVVGKLNKDRFSALAYLLWYINEFENVFKKDDDIDFDSYSPTSSAMEFDF